MVGVYLASWVNLGDFYYFIVGLKAGAIVVLVSARMYLSRSMSVAGAAGGWCCDNSLRRFEHTSFFTF